MTLVLPAPSSAQVEAHLKAGRRSEAASIARRLASDGSEKDVRELALVFARHLKSLGDVRPARRPRNDELLDLSRELTLAAASRELRFLLIARDIVDGQPIGPRTLARMLAFTGQSIEGEPAATIEEVMDFRAARLAEDQDGAKQVRDDLHALCAQELRLWGLNPERVARQGFRATYRRKVASKFSLQDRVLKEVTEKTSE